MAVLDPVGVRGVDQHGGQEGTARREQTHRRRPGGDGVESIRSRVRQCRSYVRVQFDVTAVIQHDHLHPAASSRARGTREAAPAVHLMVKCKTVRYKLMTFIF